MLAAAVAAALALVVCGRSLGRGLLLYRDFVAVPDPVLGAGTWGADGAPPRAVPLDAVTTALAVAVPPGVQQQVMLVATVFLAAMGAGLLVRRHGRAATVTAAVVAGWNPFVAERLLVGQPPTLLAYSMIPWLVLAVRSRLRGVAALGAVLAAALPSALTPWGSLSAGLVVVATAALTRHRSGRWTVGAAGLAVAWCLPWVVAALANGSSGADPDGARAFALRQDAPGGVLWSAISLGGIWAPGAAPGSRTTALAVAASALLVVAALAGVVVLARAGRRRAAASLGVAWIGPPLLAWGVSAGPGLTAFASLQHVPGVAIGRDTHRWLGISAVAAAVLTAVAVQAVAHTLASALHPREGPAGRVVTAAAVLVVTSAAVLTVPDLPAGVAAAYRPGVMPDDWEPTVSTARQLAGDGRVLVLPWAAFRAPRWARGGDVPFLDPTPRALAAPTVQSRELVVVRSPGDRRAVTVDDDARALTDLATGPRLDAAAVAGHDVRAVVVWLGTPGPLPTPGQGVVVVHRSEHFQVWSVTR